MLEPRALRRASWEWEVLTLLAVGFDDTFTNVGTIVHNLYLDRYLQQKFDVRIVLNSNLSKKVHKYSEESQRISGH